MKLSILLLLVILIFAIGVVGSRIGHFPYSTSKPSVTLPPVNFASEVDCNNMCAQMKKPNARKLCNEVCAAEFRKESRFATLTPPSIARKPYP